ncbi:serine hydrolase [uncultured Alsobacter sp.]|uniref:serine hydrolase domain-containing protein n=1 Tax=uncultured Alsobacter sp. TaxID=1748258 RepID=UPI0025F053D9|nr:serine hydrolase domain-containing protein [uncultured Alsobacter sp.]
MSSLDRRADAAFAPVRDAVLSGRIPGAVLGLLGSDGSTVFRVAGLAQREPAMVPLAADTVFDLASLTKVVFTTTAILRLVEQGRIGLDDSLASAIPDLRQYDVAGAAERKLTLRQCLTHQTHLPGVEPLYTYGQDPQTLRAFVLQRVWRHGQPVYSDINFILLGIVIERLTGQPLIDQPLPAGFTFRPDPERCAATERCTWRGRVMRGEVHDENAYALGGASGHAGLFGDAAALLSFARGLLTGGILGQSSRQELFRRQTATRSLGWEMAYEGWSGGDRTSSGTIGHTGFTGTGLWIDREEGHAWTLLTNRVHPTRHVDTGIVSLRRAVGDLVCGG